MANMNVKQLRDMLSHYPDDLVVVHGMYSDYEVVDENDWSLQNLVDQGGYVMRTHASMSEENKSKIQTFLALRGN